jgi:hypothetical protein
MYRYIKKGHSENGRWYRQSINRHDLVITTAPLLNTITALMCIALWCFDGESVYTDEYLARRKKKINYNKFFGIK